MNFSWAIGLTSILLVLLTLASVIAPLVIGHPELLSLSSIFQSLIGLAAAWALYKRNKVTIRLLLVSAFLYLGLGFCEAISREFPFYALIPAFYWSFTARILLVFWAAYLLSGSSKAKLQDEAI